MSKPSDLPPMEPATSAVVTISTQLMVAAIIFLFMVVVFIFFLHLYTRYYMGSAHARRRSRARFIFVSADQIPAPRRGLDAAALKSLPITVFRQADFKVAIDCAVCLSELSEGEEARILPKCGHGFHVECVDMWLHSHTTCPLCRAPVTAEAAGPPRAQPREGVSTSGSWPESLSFPTNVLFWGDHDRMGPGPREGTSSSRPEGALAIDIPRRAMEADDMKSPAEEKTPKSARLRSFRRLLSRGKMVVGSCSPRGGDIEQGLAGGAPGEGSRPTPKALVA